MLLCYVVSAEVAVAGAVLKALLAFVALFLAARLVDREQQFGSGYSLDNL